MSVEGAAQRRAAREEELGSLDRVWISLVESDGLCVAEQVKQVADLKTLVSRGLEVSYKHWLDVGWEAYAPYQRWHQRWGIHEAALQEAAHAVSLYKEGFDSARGWPNNDVNFNKSIVIQDNNSLQPEEDV